MLLQTGSDLVKSPPPALDSAAFDRALAATRFNIREMARFVEERDAGRFRQPWDSLGIYLNLMSRFSDTLPESK
jgi:hypothetical protein